MLQPNTFAPVQAARSADVVARSQVLERAQRYDIALPMRYRRVGEETWATGTTVNISRSGVVFEGERSMDREAAIELVLTMPVDVADGARVVARGVVVRAAAPDVADARQTFAATIADYTFVRDERNN